MWPDWRQPSYLYGLALVALPVLQHLFSRRPIRVVALPTFAFLQRAASGRRFLERWRDLLLLFTRCALLVAVVLAFAQPFVPAAFGPEAAGRRAIVIVLDRSLSMAYASGPETNYRRGCRLAAQVLSRASRQDLVNVVLADRAPTALLDRPGPVERRLTDQVLETEPTFEKADLAAALSLASDHLEKTGLQKREIFLVSDFQRTDWASAHLDALPGGIQVIFLDAVGGRPRPNRAIVELRVRPSPPRAGAGSRLEVDIWNGDARPVRVPATLEGLPGGRMSSEVTVQPYSTATASFAATFGAPGEFPIEARIPADALPGDDRRFLVAKAQPGLRVLLVTDEPLRSPAGAYFLARGLQPNAREAGNVRVTAIRSSELSSEDFSRGDLVVLGSLDRPPASFMPILARYLRDGGRAIAFLYGRSAAAHMQALERSLQPGEELPFKPLEQLDVGSRGKGHLTLSEARFESPLLRAFRDLPVAALGEVRFRRIQRTGEPSRRSEALLRFEDGTLAAALGAIGAGTLLLCNLSPRPDESDLAKSEVFAPLLHEFVKGVGQAEARERENFAGDRLVVSLPEGRGTIAVRGPDGKAIESEVAGSTTAALRAGAELPGFYVATRSGGGAKAAAVNPHPDESDLRALDPRELLGPGRPGIARLVSEGQGAMGDERGLWPYLAVAALCLLVLESALFGPPLWRTTRKA